MDNRRSLKQAIKDFVAGWNLGDVIFGGLAKRLMGWYGRSEQLASDYFASIGQPGLMQRVIPAASDHRDLNSIGAHLVYLAILTLGFGGGVVSQAGGLVGKLIGYQIELSLNTARIGISEAIEIEWRMPQNTAAVQADLAEQGWTPERGAMLKEIKRPRPSPAQLGELLRRGKIDRGTYTADLAKDGWDPADLDNVVTLLEYTPSIGDLIGMYDHFWGDDQAAARLGLDDALPPQLVEYGERQGIPQVWIEAYWRQHWAIPSAATGFELLHRLRPGRSNTPFDSTELDLLLRANGVPSQLRSQLEELSYNPLPRLVVNALYGAGRMTADDVYQMYLDNGYSPANAQLLTTYTTDVKNGPLKDITRGAVITSYNDGLIDAATVRTMLEAIGLSEDDITFYLAQADYANAQQNISDTLAAVKAQYIAGAINDVSVYAVLGPLNLPSERVNVLLQAWNVARDAHVNVPNKSDVDSWYKAGIISGDQFKTYYKRLRYNETDTGIYLRQLDIEIQQSAILAAATAQSAQAAQAALPKPSTTALARANIGVSLAQARAHIADDNVAINDPTTAPDQLAALKQDVVLTRDLIASLNLELAKIQAGQNAPAGSR
jgi:hypothetical protein